MEPGLRIKRNLHGGGLEEMISAGIDCGAKNTKAIIMKDGQIIGKGQVLTGFDQKKARR